MFMFPMTNLACKGLTQFYKAIRYHWDNELTHLHLVLHIYVSESGQQWFR